MSPHRRSRLTQRGATAVEFALGLLIFLTFFLGIWDFSRMLYTWSAAQEAARAGARYAAVCDDTGRASQVLAHMQALVPQISSVSVLWEPAACDASNCTGVTVRITDLEHPWISPIVGMSRLAPIPMPEFASYLPREVMRQDPHSPAFCGP